MSSEPEFEIPDDLVDALADSKCAAFIGSGFSRQGDERMPTWTEFIEQLRTEIGALDDEVEREDIEAYPLEALERLEEESRDFKKAIKGTLSGPNKVSASHEILAKLPFEAVITTNLDEMLEEAFRSVNQRPIVVADEKDIPRLAERRGMPVIKMHGTIKNRESQVLTMSDYFEFDQHRDAMKALVLGYLSQCSILMIGAGLKDPNFQKLYSIVHESLGGFKQTVYYLHAGVPRFVQDVWNKRGLEFIRVEHDALENWLSKLRDRVRDRSGERARAKMKAKTFRYGKEQGLRRMGDCLQDYEQLQREYTALVHMRDFEMFENEWDRTLYESSRQFVSNQMTETSVSEIDALVYVAPGPHAPLLSDDTVLREIGRSSLDKLLLVDIDDESLSVARQETRAPDREVETLQSDITAGVGEAFCDWLSALADALDNDFNTACEKLDSRSAADRAREIVDFDDRFAGGSRKSWIHQANDWVGNSTVLAYSELVASFTGTAPFLGFRSRLYEMASENGWQNDDVNWILEQVLEVWREYNKRVYSAHVHDLTQIGRDDSQSIIIADSKKEFHDNNIRDTKAFPNNRPKVVDPLEDDVELETRKNWIWEDHPYGFEVELYGREVVDFAPHQHRISARRYQRT